MTHLFIRSQTLGKRIGQLSRYLGRGGGGVANDDARDRQIDVPTELFRHVVPGAHRIHLARMQTIE